MFKCVDCERPTEGSEMSPGAVSAICPDCLNRRKEGKEPAHVRADAKKLKRSKKKTAADAAE